MQFLHEEFFGKTYGFIKKINVLPIRIFLKLFFWVVIFGVLGFLVWLYFTGKIKWIFIIVGVFLIGEIAHILRKLREKAMSMHAEESSNIQDQLSDADVIKKSKKRIKKKDLNKELLKKSVKVKVTKEKVVNKNGLLWE
tara:strand:+ start:325 stop:741 length:417 start_codon:yes stop_codon:yes gene_type:complete